jgi:hypothetical protein
MTKAIIIKRLLLFMVLGLWMTGGYAASVSYNQALSKAEAFLMAQHHQYGLTLVPDEQQRARGTNAEDGQLLYIFNIGDDNGFVILSGDDRTPSVLGYADTGRFDYEQLPDNARAWIDGYAQQIASLGDEVPISKYDGTMHPAIAPLLTCSWNQLAPYNNECPTFFTGRKSATGCVATAMAQVLYYHRAQSVNTLLHEIPAYNCNNNYVGYGRLHVNSKSAGSVIDWDNMLDTYKYGASSGQKKAVADLMSYCGAAVEMNYRDEENGGSSASSWSIVGALGKYFGYSADIAHKERSQFANEDWIDLICRELSQGRPVIISGMSDRDIGHAFVCDGFDSQGLFHFNWGWGGIADGYYTLENLRPTAQGVGGLDDDYNNDVSAIVGIHPDDGTNPYVERPCLTVLDILSPDNEVLERSVKELGAYAAIKYLFRNDMTSTHDFEMALAWYKDGERVRMDQTARNLGSTKEQVYKLSGNCYLGGDLENGSYQIKPASRLIGADEWLDDNGSEHLYIKAIVEDSQISFKVIHSEEEEKVDDENGQGGENGDNGNGQEDEPKPLVTLMANDYTREYGDDNPEFEFTADSVIEGTPQLMCEATATSPVGDYPITISQGSVDYPNCEFVGGTLTITKAPLTIKVGSYSRRQGEENPEFVLEYEGFKNGETEDVLTQQPVVTTEAVRETAPGSYEITVSGAEAENYEITYIMGELTVKEADPIMLTAQSYTREYGDENPVFEFSTEGAALEGEPAIACEATTASPVGTYPIIITKGDVRNYNDSYVNGTLTITKAPLVVAVGNYSREVGEENPEFKLTYTGWKNGETEEVLLAKPVVVTTATKESEAGTYQITISGGEALNYELSYTDGELTVNVPAGIADERNVRQEVFDIYTISGQKVRKAAKTMDGLPKGIYIVKGKRTLKRIGK